MSSKMSERSEIGGKRVSNTGLGVGTLALSIAIGFLRSHDLSQLLASM